MTEAKQKKSSKELYRRYRPATLDDMYGNDHLKSIMRNFLKEGNLPHCILLTGGTGCGKTTLARILKTELDCDDTFGWHELDASSMRGIDTARELGKQSQFKPAKGKSRIFLLDECHNFGVGGSSEKNLAQNALLKTLENCPEWCYFILCTTNPEMLLKTIRGRCIEYQLDTLNDDEMTDLVSDIAKKEGKKIPKKVLSLVSKNAFGHPRNAVQILQSIMSLGNVKDMIKMAKKEADKQSGVNELAYALLDDADWPTISQILRNLFKAKVDPESIRRSIMGMMQSGILNGWAESKSVDPLTILEVFVKNPTFTAGAPAIVYCCRKLWNDNGED